MHSALDEQAVGTPRRAPTRSRRGGGNLAAGHAETPRVLIRIPDLRSVEGREEAQPEVRRFDRASDRGGPHYQYFRRSTPAAIRSSGSLRERVHRLLERVKLALTVARWVRRPSAVTAAILAMAAQLVAFLGYLYWFATGTTPETTVSPAPSVATAPSVQLTEPTLAPPKPTTSAPNLPNLPSATPHLGDPRDLPPWENWPSPQALPSPTPSSNSSTQSQGPAASVAARSTYQTSNVPAVTTPPAAKPGTKPQAAARLSGEIKKLQMDPSHEHARPGLY